MRVFLVDFENVKSEGLRCVEMLDSGDQVITFFSKNAESMSMDTYFNLIHSKARFYAVRLDRTGSNALDFQLVSYLGYLMGTAVDQDVFVISKDHGFHSAVSFCRNFLIPQSKYHKTVSQYPSIAALYPNQAEGRAAGINDIPLFLREEPIEVQLQEPVEVTLQEPVAEILPVELPKQEPIEPAAVQVEEKEPVITPVEKEEPVVAENKEATSVQPKRRDKNQERRPERRFERNERPVLEEPKASAPRSDWDEISAAAEAGLQIIDMFGGAEVKAPKKEEPEKEAPKQEVPVEEKAASSEAQIEIKDFLTPMAKEPEKLEVVAPIVVEPELPMAEPEKTETVLSGSEIDRMLEEFLEEAAAAIEAELKEMPETDLGQFIEIETEQETAKPEEVQSDQPKEAVVSEEKAPEVPVKEHTRKNSRSRKEKQPKSAEAAVEPNEEKEAVKSAEPQETPAEEAPKPKVKKERKEKQPKEVATESAQIAPDARETVRKALSATIEIKDEETKNDLEKLIDCILDATGKQDLYRMIIKLFGQKTGLEYYKVVKREYTNICNQIGKK